MRGGDERIDLLSNGSATSAWFPVKVGGIYLWSIEGTFNSGSYQLQLQNANGTATDITGASMSAAGFMEVDLPPGGQVRAVETGTTSAMYSTLVRMPEGAGIGTFDTEVVQGNVASGATDSGNPVKVAGVYAATPSAASDGQRRDVSVDTRGQIRVVVSDYNHANGGNLGAVVSAFNGDAQGIGSLAGVVIKGSPYLYNGSSVDRARNNTDITALASAARTTTLNSGDLTNYNGRGCHVVLDVTNAGTGSITLTIQAKDALSGQYYTLLAGAAVTTVSTNVYKVFPGATAVANAAANDILPRTYRILVTHNNANSITYSVGASIIL